MRRRTERSDQARLLRIQIQLKIYMFGLFLAGCVFLNFFNVFEITRFSVTELVVTLLLLVLSNLGYLYIPKKTNRLFPLYVLVGFTDILFFTILIHFLGGSDTPVLALFYMLLIPFFSISISPAAGYIVAIAGFVAYAFLCGLETTGVLSYYGGQPISLEKLGIILFFLLFCFLSLAFFVGIFSDVLRRNQKALAEASREIERHNLTLEEKIAQRTKELEKAREKLHAYSKQLEEAYNEKSLQLEAVQKKLETSLGELKLKYNYEKIVGETVPMRDVFRLMDKVTDFSVAILIQGESGTGKELVAKAIHYNGPRREKPFIIQNCSAITDTLLESELFGHVKGAFTGAYQDRKGLFEEADQGTLFLDEIGDMSPGMQAKLLRAIQEGEIRPVGGKRVIRVDVRIISATNTDLKAAVEKGAFREDLYYRLNGVTIHIPPLRERREDILLLADYFLKSFAAEAEIGVKSLSQETKKLLFSYAWPGNVRELENTIKHACVIAQGTDILLEDFRYKPELFASSMLGDGDHRGAVALIEDKKHGGDGDIEHTAGEGNQGRGTVKTLKDTEKEAIETALRVCDGKRKEAAKLLNVPIRTLYEKIKRYDIA